MPLPTQSIPIGPAPAHGFSVLLAHTMPSASPVPHHIDWLILPRAFNPAAPPDPDDRCLITFRLESRPDWSDPTLAFEADRLPDHRAMYLSYEGPVSGGGHGDVRRLERLPCVVSAAAPELLDVQMNTDDATVVLRGTRLGAESEPGRSRWRFARV
jgi:hypothetical protein